MTACIVADCSRQLRDHEDAALMVVCSPCVDRMRATLRAIPAALVVLREGSMQRERTGETGRAGTREAPLPCRIDTLNLIGPAATGTVHDPHGDQIGQRPISDVLGSWVRLVCEERRINGPERWTEVALSGWLASQLGFAATQGWVAEMAGELRDLTWAIKGIARVEVRTRAISRPCPRCQMMTLSRTDHDAYTRCSECGTAWTDAELNADAERRAAA
jgi:hypothetical protein